MPKNKDEVLRKYKGIKLGACMFRDYEYDIHVLTNFDELFGILVEVVSHESYLTKKGFEFLEEYYGFENLAQMLAEENGIDADLETKEDIHNWLVAQKNYAENSDSDD